MKKNVLVILFLTLVTILHAQPDTLSINDTLMLECTNCVANKPEIQYKTANEEVWQTIDDSAVLVSDNKILLSQTAGLYEFRIRESVNNDACYKASESVLIQLTENATVEDPEIFTSMVTIQESGIVAEPKNAEMHLQETAILDVDVHSGGNLTYQWFLNSIMLTGETNDTLKIWRSNFVNEGKYFCKINDGCADYTTTIFDFKIKTFENETVKEGFHINTWNGKESEYVIKSVSDNENNLYYVAQFQDSIAIDYATDTILIKGTEEPNVVIVKQNSG